MSSGSPFLNIGQIIAVFQSLDTTAVAKEVLNKLAKGSAMKVANNNCGSYTGLIPSPFIYDKNCIPELFSFLELENYRTF